MTNECARHLARRESPSIRLSFQANRHIPDVSFERCRWLYIQLKQALIGIGSAHFGVPRDASASKILSTSWFIKPGVWFYNPNQLTPILLAPIQALKLKQVRRVLPSHIHQTILSMNIIRDLSSTTKWEPATVLSLTPVTKVLSSRLRDKE